MAHIHENGLVHHDLKPANLLITPAAGGEPLRVQIVDFGLSRDAGALDTPWEEVTYPWRNLPMFFPLQLKAERMREEDAHPFAADVWSVGMILLWLLLGRTAIGVERSDAFARELLLHFGTSRFCALRGFPAPPTHSPSAPRRFAAMLQARPREWGVLIEAVRRMLDVDEPPTTTTILLLCSVDDFACG